jgi:hypothetical protein
MKGSQKRQAASKDNVVTLDFMDASIGLMALSAACASPAPTMKLKLGESFSGATRHPFAGIWYEVPVFLTDSETSQIKNGSVPVSFI